ncbi:MAG TPA: hypothetical protein VGM83_01425 [Devosiaceae bacterium]|jgi:hypothetical protein
MLAQPHQTRINEEARGLQRPQEKETRKAGRARLLAGIGALSAAMISLGYSVYQQRDAGNVPLAKVATPIEAGRWKVSVLASTVGSTLPNGLPASPDKKAITVEMTLENISSESSNLYGDLVELADISHAPRPDYYLLRDHNILWDLQPRMPEAVAAVWEVPAAMDLPEVLHLRVEGSLFKPRDNLYAAPGWFPTGSVAEIDLPLDKDSSGGTP